MRKFQRVVATLIFLFAAQIAGADFIVLQSTTSTQNSGLFDYILPQFEEQIGIEVRVVAVGTGQAIRNAKNGDGDVLLVHAKSSEEAFVFEGHGLARYDVMYNDFVIVGPQKDPAGVGTVDTLRKALTAIIDSGSRFVSRGDDSGTHRAELRLWANAEFDPSAHSGEWYIETGSGMGATLNMASGMSAYTLTDRATWLAFKNKRDLVVVFEGDKGLFNQYGVIVVNPAAHPTDKSDMAQAFVDWLTGAPGQSAIAAYKLEDQQLFFPNAR